jgi:hypothetical protein
LMPNQRRSWLGRNWKWLLAAVFVCGIAFVFGIVALVMGAMRGSDVAKEAVGRAQTNPIVKQRLGDPVSEGWLVGGSINVSTGSGDADLSIPISGPKGKGTVYVTAQKAAGTWAYSLMQAAIEGSGEKIDLLADGTTPGTTAFDRQSSAPGPTVQAAAQSQPATPDPTVDMAAPPQPATSDPPAAAVSFAPAAAAAPGSVIASAQYSNDPNVRCDLLELKRVSGGVLVARWRITNTGTKVVKYDFNWDDFYYIDPAANKKYNNLTLDGKRIMDVWNGNLQPGEQHLMWVKYSAPPATSKRISLNVPRFPPFEDAPVSD